MCLQHYATPRPPPRVLTSETQRPQVPQHQMVIRPLRNQLVTVAHQLHPQRPRVRLHLLRVRLELRAVRLLKRHSQRPDLMVVGPTLEGGKDGEIDFVLEVVHCSLGLSFLGGFGTLPVEDHARTWAPQTLVSGRGNDVAEFEGVVGFLVSGERAKSCEAKRAKGRKGQRSEGEPKTREPGKREGAIQKIDVGERG